MGDTIDKVIDCIRAFGLQNMSYRIRYLEICHERRLEMKTSFQSVCSRCNSDKYSIKMISAENSMAPKPLPDELATLSVIEPQLIFRIFLA